MEFQKTKFKKSENEKLKFHIFKNQKGDFKNGKSKYTI